MDALFLVHLLNGVLMIALPVGLGIERMFEIGQLPVFVQLEADYSVIHPEDRVGSRWDFRLNIIPVIPTFLF